MVHLKCAFLSVESHEAKAKHRLSRASCQGSAVWTIVTPRPPRAGISATCTLDVSSCAHCNFRPLCVHVPCVALYGNQVLWCEQFEPIRMAVLWGGRCDRRKPTGPTLGGFLFFQGGWDPRSRLCVWKWMICCLSRQWPVGACLTANWSHGVNGKHEEKAED